ncbi:MAG: histidine kinase [Oscillospiraceae bacterium]
MFEKKKLLYKYFLDFFIIIFTSFIIVSGLIFYVIFHSANTQKQLYRNSLETQVFLLIDNLSEQCNSIFTQLSVKDDVNRFFLTNLSTLNEFDLYALTKPLVYQLRNYTFNNNISSVYLYSFENNAILNDSGVDLTNNLEQHFWYDSIIKNYTNHTYWTDIITDESTGVKYLSLFKSINDSKDPDGIIVILIKYDELEKQLLDILKSGNNSFVLRDNQKNQLLFTIGDAYQKIIKKHNIQEPITDFSNILKERDYSEKTISERNWQCVLIYDTTSLYGINKYIFLLFPLLILFILLITSYISYRRAKITYRPIDDLMSLLDNSENNIISNLTSYKKYDELKYIYENITHTIKDKNDLKNELSKRINQLDNAKSIALQAQIHPHFIFNTLELINLEACSLSKGDNIVSQMICSLSDIMRISFQSDGYFIRISDELLHARQYIYIQSLRYKDKFDVVWNIEEQLNSYLTAKLILQPFIENAIIHGIIPSKKHCNLIISAKEDNNNIIFTIEDNGKGIDAQKLSEIKNSLKTCEDVPKRNIGITNVNLRIKIIYGQNYGCSIDSNDVKTTVVITIPKML